MIYADHLLRAAERTRALGFALPSGAGAAPPVATVLAAIEGLADLHDALAASLARAECDISLECARLVLAALPRLAAASGSAPLITVGSVACDGVPVLCADVENLGELRRRACYHVWLSFKDEQVVDLTMMAQLALLQRPAAPRIEPIVGPFHQISRVRWRPYLIGEAIVAALVGADGGPR